jgi:hypothetical protein
MAQRDWWTNWNLSYLGDIYGPLVGGHSVQEAVYRTLEEWLPSYIAEFNRNLGSEVLVKPFEYRHRPDFRTLPRNASAAILISVPSTVGPPEVYQNAIRANWRVEAMVYVYGTKDWQETEALTQAYAACIRACIIQKRGLDGFAETTLWDGEEYLEGEHSSGRTTGIAHVRFIVTVGNSMNMYGGTPSPQFAAAGAVTTPSTDVPSEVPIAEDVNVTITKEPL